MDKEKQLCVFCNKREATTKDHVPPKGIFSKPRPLNLITVPACDTCNGSWSNLDEIFKLFVSLKAGKEGTSELKLHQSTKRTVDHNRKLRQFLIDRSKKVELVTPAGIYLGNAYSLSIPKDDLNSMCKRIIEGLYFHHYQELIQKSGTLSIYYPKEPDETVLDLVKDCKLEIIGDDREFLYCHARIEEEELASVWVLLFYKRFLVVGIDVPENKNIE